MLLSCPFHMLTGFDCPFCGGQRMVLALLQGHWTEAFWLNPGLAVGAPLVGAWWLWKREITSRAAFVILCIAVAWGVLRNILPISAT